MSMLSKLLFGSRRDNPANAARPYLDQAMNTQTQYVNRGQGASDQLYDQQSRMAADPNAYYNEIAKNYQQSDNFKQQLAEGLGAAGNSAAAGGMRGSPMDQDYSAKLAAHLQGEDFQKWYQNVMGIHSQGQAGQQHTADTGFMASGNQADIYGNQAELATKSQDWENRRRKAFMDAYLKFNATGLGAIGGAAVGGPAGAVAGAQVGANAFK